MNALQSRKQLLIAESELNRAQLVEDLNAMTTTVRSLADRAKSFTSLAPSAAVLVAGLAAIQRIKSADPGSKPSWLGKMLKAAELVTTFWLAFRSSGRQSRDP